MKILLFGKNGQLGWELQRSLAPLGELLAVSAQSTDYCGDLTNVEGIARTVREIRPDFIVNAAAYTAVDKAESEPELAHMVNAVAPAVLAEEAIRCNSALVHYSTDYVFDGRGDLPWNETAKTNPLSIYGKTKLAGELAIQSSGCAHLVFRTSWVVGARGNNFAKTMLRLAQERDELSVINDQFGAPTGADLLADVTAHCIRKFQEKEALGGLYHLAAGGVTTWYDYARFVIEFARQHGVKIRVAPESIRPILSDAYPLPAQRPRNSRLDTNKLQKAFDLTLPAWQTNLTRIVQEISESI